MASDKPQYTHISVEPDDDDEFVVEAGILPGGEQASAAEEGQDSQFTPEVEASGAPTHAPDGTAHSITHIVQRPSGAEGAQAQGESDQTKTSVGSAYREQTLQDLDAGPMSNMQKYVIGFLVIFVIAFIAYCFLFFGK